MRAFRDMILFFCHSCAMLLINFGVNFLLFASILVNNVKHIDFTLVICIIRHISSFKYAESRICQLFVGLIMNEFKRFTLQAVRTCRQVVHSVRIVRLALLKPIRHVVVLPILP